MMLQFDRFHATFIPCRTDDLQPGSEVWIGRRLEWQALHVERKPFERWRHP